MNFGNAWEHIMGKCDKDTSFSMLDYFYDMGGNFIDTANGYQAEESETWLGEWMAKTPGRRDEIVLATKYTSGFKTMSEPGRMQSNFGGNSAKSLHVSVEQSLRKLQTTYIDLLYVHYWDLTASVPEVMQSLNHLVAQGKVLYLGISDTPAWVVVKCNDYAREHGLRQFSVYQGRWSAAERDFERDILPMCMDQGMSLAPWGALGGGYFKPKEQVGKDGGRNMPSVRSGEGKEADVAEKLEAVAKRKNTPITSVALAYVLHKSPWVFPICGGRKIEHLKGNIEALSLELSQEDIEEIETGYDFNVGFPMNFLGGGKNGAKGPESIVLSRRLGTFDYVEQPKPIKPVAATSETVRDQGP
jgi:aryl-alcohol dehydrogenase-like predicted oxidoreductase